MRRLSTVVLAALALAACKKQEPVTTAAAPTAAMPAPPAGMTEVKGKVLEKLDAPPYSYLKIAATQGETWTAVPKTDAAVGAEVTVAGAIPMKDFESKTLNRKFELVYFGSLGGSPAVPHAQGGPPPTGGMPGGMGGGMPPPGMGGAPTGGMPDMAAQHAAAANVPDVGDVKVDKATGADARTIAEVHAQRTALKDKAVSVRGKVVKFNEGIMGRNWLHLRDGTGAANTNDLTVTTNEKVNVGDVVVVKGKVQVDKDFGTGHPYPVIVEDAKLGK
ncbi:MAG: nucleotide-binding protein [Anaeromyxobacteraceae bacterium]